MNRPDHIRLPRNESPPIRLVHTMSSKSYGPTEPNDFFLEWIRCCGVTCGFTCSPVVGGAYCPCAVRRTARFAWEAYEVERGAAFLSLGAPQGWQRVKRWLSTLAAELQAGPANLGGL